METVQTLERQREQILREMAKLRSMETGSLSSQMLKVPRKGKKTPVLRGPYYVLSRWEDGKTHSRRVKRGELAQVQCEVANYQRFAELCEQFVDATRRLGALERTEEPGREQLKKGLMSRSSRAGKSRA